MRHNNFPVFLGNMFSGNNNLIKLRISSVAVSENVFLF